MKNKKIAIAVLSGVLVLAAGTLGITCIHVNKATASSKTLAQETSVSAENSKKKDSEEKANSDEDESGMMFFQADARGNLIEEDADTNAEEDAGTNADMNADVKADENTDGNTDINAESNVNNEIGKKPPVSIQVTYYLNNKKISPEELAGKTGKVKIRFDYENLVPKTVTVDGERIQTHVPFMMMTAVMMPEDTFTNVEITNGEIMEDDDQSIVLGTAFPSLRESLKLEKIEEAKDVSLPDYVEITADAVDFELEFTANIIVPIGLDELDDEAFDDVDELMDGMDELGDASESLADGAGELFSGMEKYQTALKAYTDGVGQLESSIKAINAAVAKVSLPDDESMTAVSGAATSLAKDAADLSASMTKLQSSLTGLQEFTKTLGSYVMAVETAKSTIIANMDDASGAIAGADSEATTQARNQARDMVESVVNSSTSLTDEQKQELLNSINYDTITVTGTTSGAAADIENTRNQMAAIPALTMPELPMDMAGITTILTDMQKQLQVLGGFSTGMSGISEGISSLTLALQQLESGAAQLADNNDEVIAGIDALVDGTKDLEAGMNTFDKEGIQELRDLSGEDLTTFIKRLKAAREAERGYKTVVGNDVGFVIETESIYKN
ncbi:MAG: hypothetical protein PHC41_14470 [Lachnospiraceae bacterium]|nr:hypothetical protein [Lachnospiraceae bacterium]MDD3617410.1 hypothetical protein [Lachnospiraceae bacterium]